MSSSETPREQGAATPVPTEGGTAAFHTAPGTPILAGDTTKPASPASPASTTTTPTRKKLDDEITEAPAYDASHAASAPNFLASAGKGTTPAEEEITVASPTSVSSSKGGGAFGAGAATSGPATPDEKRKSLHERAATAESGLSLEVRMAIEKGEVKDAKRLSKVIKNEAKAEDKSFKHALKELDKLQKVQKEAVSDETSAASKHGKAVKLEHKLNRKYLAAKAKYEAAAAQLKARTEQLEATKTHAGKTTELLATKSAEVDQLRAQKATDDREREAKLQALNGVISKK